VGFNEIGYTAMSEQKQVRSYGNRGEVMCGFSAKECLNFITVRGMMKKVFVTKIVNVLIIDECIAEIGEGH
jgi:hypothetical protein